MRRNSSSYGLPLALLCSSAQSSGLFSHTNLGLFTAVSRITVDSAIKPGLQCLSNHLG